MASSVGQGQKAVSGSGNKIKVEAALLPLGCRDEPKDVTVTATGEAKANGETITVTTTALGKGATTITISVAAAITDGTINVDGLLRDIPSGTPIIFNAGTVDESSTTTTAPANATDTTLSVVALTVPLAAGDTATVAVDGATTIDVSAIPNALSPGTTVTFNKGAGTEQTVTITAAAAANATSLTVEPLTTNLTAGDTGVVNPNTTLNVLALSDAIAGGSRITFNKGLANESRVYLTEDALKGATTINFESLSTDVSVGATAEYIARLRILGGTSTGRNINPNRTAFTVFEDEQGFEDGIIANGSWEVPWSGNFLVDDEGYERIEEAVFTSAKNGREIYMWLSTPIPIGKTTPPVTRGATTITGFSDVIASDGIITNSWTFNGQGTPERERAA